MRIYTSYRTFDVHGIVSSSPDENDQMRTDCGMSVPANWTEEVVAPFYSVVTCERCCYDATGEDEA